MTFKKGQRKDDVAHEYLARCDGDEGVLFVGKAQEKASVFRTEKRRRPDGTRYPWIIRSTTPVNHYDLYILDRDFGPLFIKFCSYFPYAAKVCLNGHEWLKRQLTQRGIPFEPLDNGIRSTDAANRVQRIADTLDAAKIDALFRKWLRRLPHPFAAAHRAAGYRYQLSILQAEFALTQVLDRPRTGRCFFEEVIRENLDVGRPDQVQLIFNRRITRRTPGQFRTRVITEGVVPSLHVQYKKSKVKQYHKEGQALRTETTINDTYDFEIGRALHNLPALREIGFAANRRLLRVEHLSHDCLIGEDDLEAVSQPIVVDHQSLFAKQLSKMSLQTGQILSKTEVQVQNRYSVRTVACNSFVTVTARFRLIYVFVVLDVGTAKSCTGTSPNIRPLSGRSSSSEHVSPGRTSIAYVVHDHDAICSLAVDCGLSAMGCGS